MPLHSSHTAMPRLFPLIFGGIGLLMVAITLVLLWFAANAHAGLASTRGAVVDLEFSYSSSISRRGTRASARPVVRYTVDDIAYTLVGTVGSTPPAYDIDEAVTVYYDPANPADGRIDSFLERWFAPIITGFIGTIFSFLGGVFWWASRKA